MAHYDPNEPKPVPLGEILLDASLRPDELTKSREELVKEAKRKIDEGLHLMADGVRLFVALHPAIAEDEKNAFAGQLMETRMSIERVIRSMEIIG
jgi:hypothetical protein